MISFLLSGMSTAVSRAPRVVHLLLHVERTRKIKALHTLLDLVRPVLHAKESMTRQQTYQRQNNQVIAAGTMSFEVFLFSEKLLQHKVI